jgi:hypothetical protein
MDQDKQALGFLVLLFFYLWRRQVKRNRHQIIEIVAIQKPAVKPDSESWAFLSAQKMARLIRRTL